MPAAAFLPTTASAAPLRFDSVDALRGLAMVWMTVFHFCFDLSHFGLWPQNFLGDPFWTWQRSAIVSLFVFCAGLGQAMALHQGQGWGRFRRRWLQIGAGALLVSAGSYLMFPRSFIYFGVLHGMAVMLLLLRPLAGSGAWLWPLGALALGLPWGAEQLLNGPWAMAAPWFDSRLLNGLGLISHKPFTEDYVPVLPWLGVMCWGLAAGQWLLRRHPLRLAQPLGGVGRRLALLGRWSLSYYLLHQPVLLGLLALFMFLRT
jgi:uncharacterized membrane protein